VILFLVLCDIVIILFDLVIILCDIVIILCDLVIILVSVLLLFLIIQMITLVSYLSACRMIHTRTTSTETILTYVITQPNSLSFVFHSLN